MCRDFRKMLDTNYLRAWDLQGDTTVTITRIEPEKVGWGKKARTMPVFYFLELNKGLACNATNGATIGQVHGTYDPDVLLGKQITLYPTTTEMQGSLAECIRVRPKGFVPRGTPARIAQQVHQNNQRREQQQPQQPNGKPVNGKPVVTQADQLLADQAFQKELDAELKNRGFNEAQVEVFTNELCRTMAIGDVYELEPSQREAILGKLASGRYDRYLKPVGGVQQVA